MRLISPVEIVDRLQRAAADRTPIEPRDQESAGRLSGRRLACIAAIARVEAVLETLVEFLVIGCDALPRVAAVFGLDADGDSGCGHQRFDLGHRGDEPVALRAAQRVEQRLGEVVRKRVVGGAFRQALGGQRHQPAPPVAGVAFDRDQPIRFERFEQPADIARIQPEPLAQRAYVAAVRSDLEQQPRLAERPAAAEIAVVERAGAQRDRTVEAAHLFDERSIHNL